MVEPISQANGYKNVMELLVDAEIDRQTWHISAEQAKAINRIEVAAYALNRLPPLYASSIEGVALQHERGQVTFGDRLTAIVSQALETIQDTPHRSSTPFEHRNAFPPQSPQTALQELADYC